jgi:hypothetical protein
MAQQRENIFEAYKPLRNHLRKCELADSLEVIRLYAQNLQFKNSNFPPKVEVLDEFLQKDHVQKTRWVSEWNLEILAKEVIINSPISEWNAKTFRRWAYFIGAVNKLKDIEGQIATDHIDVSNILRELERMAHGQFGWQIGRPSAELMARYYRIYSTLEMDALIKNTIVLTTKELYFMGVALTGSFLTHFALHYPPKIEIPGLTQEAMDKFLKYFSSDLPSLKEKLISEQNINENYFYAFSSLRGCPIIRMDFEGRFCLTCPIPTLLFWRITSGLYYEVVDQKGFDNAFGASFQKYIGDCISVSNTNKNIAAFPEEKIREGKNEKDTVDWIIDDGKSAIFIECKAKRMTMPSKTELVINEAFRRDLEKMAGFIVQIYKTIRDYQDGKYPSCSYDEKKKVYPLVVTLEDWHLFGDNDLLKVKIEEKLKAENIPLDWLSSMPYTICSAQEFEEMIQIIQSKDIDGVVGKKSKDPEKVKWAMASFLSSEYPDEHKNTKALFLKDFDSIFPDEIVKKIKIK